jgi:hypothetical protein
MNKSKIRIYIIFFLAFLSVFFLPKPDIRIHKLKNAISKEANTLIIGNSILEHQTPCAEPRVSIKNLYPNASVIGEGGLLLEEISLATYGSNIKNLIIVASTYNFFQPMYYPAQTHKFYGDDNGVLNLYLSYPLSKKNLWRLDEEIVFGGTILKRSEASLRVKTNYAANRCGAVNWKEVELLDSVHTHTHNNFENSKLQMQLLKNLNDRFNLKILIVPVWIGEDIFSKKTTLKYQSELKEISQKLNGLDVRHEVLDVSYDVSNYDEPWCMCAHLSGKGRVVLETGISKLINGTVKP